MNNIEIIFKREAPAFIHNDGKQTPTKGHPVFVAQHATATCCRECIRKWHKIQPGKELSRIQQDYLVDVIMTWIQSEVDRYNSWRNGERKCGKLSIYLMAIMDVKNVLKVKIQR